MGAAKKVVKKASKYFAQTAGLDKVADELKRPFDDFKDSLMPDIPDVQEAPEANLAGVEAAEAERRRRRSGRGSTILTGAGGTARTANVGTSQLLGQ